ncbi:hypothetical protein GDO78_011405 [Eleutherodactylus coqui]|uniref:Uncharacterized protein n=1 Tax=Eleutherodactylus coqui TaxID=57060 RepID=A0A8J6K872_ELECQ|nr:hypothetical protein GDO78_011405 [Eleutherodactylus coqui]
MKKATKVVKSHLTTYKVLGSIITQEIKEDGRDKILLQSWSLATFRLQSPGVCRAETPRWGVRGIWPDVTCGPGNRVTSPGVASFIRNESENKNRD